MTDAAPATRSTAATSGAEIDSLRADVAEVLGVSPDELADHDDLVDAGLDSVRLLALVNRWQGAGASFLALAETPTLSAWSLLLRSGAAGAP